MPVKPIRSYDEFVRILKSDRVSIIDFWAEWCHSSEAIWPEFKRISELHEFSNVDFYSCDSEEQEPVAYECSIRGMPTFTVLHAGQKVDELMGAYPQKLEEMIRTVSRSPSPSGDATPVDK